MGTQGRRAWRRVRRGGGVRRLSEEEESEDDDAEEDDEDSEAGSEEDSDSDDDSEADRPRAGKLARAGGRSAFKKPRAAGTKNKYVRKRCIHNLVDRCWHCGQETQAESMKRRGIKAAVKPNAAENWRRYAKTTLGIRKEKERRRGRPSKRKASNTSNRPLTPKQVTTIWNWHDISPSGLATLSQQLGIRIRAEVAWHVWHRNRNTNITATLATLAHHSEWTKRGTHKK